MNIKSQLSNLNPYNFCNVLSETNSFATMLEDFVIKVPNETKIWVIKCKSREINNKDSLSVIRPTELGTIEFSIPILNFSLETIVSVESITSLNEMLNGSLYFISNGVNITLYYNAYIPVGFVLDLQSLRDLKSFEECGNKIKSEIRFIKQHVGKLKNISSTITEDGDRDGEYEEDEEDEVLDLDNLNKMVNKDYLVDSDIDELDDLDNLNDSK